MSRARGTGNLFIRKGVRPEKIVVTGIPNFDDCAKFLNNDFPYPHYVLVCTSDTRETFKYENRKRFIRKALAIAGGRQLLFKLHPNENVARAAREIGSSAPGALVFATGSAEEMIANCDVLITRYSTTVYVGLALGKECYSEFDLDELRRMVPLQNGMAAAEYRPGLPRAAGKPRAPGRLGRGPHAGKLRTAETPGAHGPGGGMNIVVVVQARTSSTRLPGKVLLPLAGRPLLERMLERVRAARTPFTLVVATTTNPGDQPIRDLCAGKNIICYCGHPTDLLDRHYRAARSLVPDAVVKIPSDCPLIDPAVIDRVLGFYVARHDEYDFVSNLHPPSWPDGNDVEVMSLAALEAAWKEARTPVEREHTTPFIWDPPGAVPDRQRGMGNRTQLLGNPPVDHRLYRGLPPHQRRVR